MPFPVKMDSVYFVETDRSMKISLNNILVHSKKQVKILRLPRIQLKKTLTLTVLDFSYCFFYDVSIRIDEAFQLLGNNVFYMYY